MTKREYGNKLAADSVLVTTAGTIVAQGIIKCLKLANSKSSSSHEKYRIVTTDMSADAAGLYRSDAAYLVPPFFSPSENYISSIIKICKEESIRAVFLGADEELFFMAEEKERIRKETGAMVVASSPQVISTCVDKWKTFEFLKSNNLPRADSVLPSIKEQSGCEEFFKDHSYPAIVKPREGHGSLLVFTVRNQEETSAACQTIERAGWKPMIQEHLQGEEFTIGVTVNREGNSVMSSIAMKRTLKGGQTYKAFVDDYKEIRKTCKNVALKFQNAGPFNIQGRLVDGELRIFEINPRFSASCPIRAAAGVNEPDIIFRNFIEGEQISVESYERLVCMRYWNEVYTPLANYEALKKDKKRTGSGGEVKDYF